MYKKEICQDDICRKSQRGKATLQTKDVTTWFVLTRDAEAEAEAEAGGSGSLSMEAEAEAQF